MSDEISVMSDRANRIVVRSGFASLCSTIVALGGSALVAGIVAAPSGTEVEFQVAE